MEGGKGGGGEESGKRGEGKVARGKDGRRVVKEVEGKSAERE